MVLSATEGLQLEKMAQIADKIAGIPKFSFGASGVAHSGVEEVSQELANVSTSKDNLRDRLCQLDRQVDKLSTIAEKMSTDRRDQNGAQNRGRSYSRNRSFPRTNSN